ncbi:hypothetical protein CAEBREN_13159 [Caenorhabditis brenneri]|uniref:Uncharacterized protein n=1 Tax=Caenorhabditis brenneri TaxID=135651 RepID=G0MHN4_CAEBE|nr:hypothetical protein CAEBREN_13159 [Caenorhabditis brenneri]
MSFARNNQIISESFQQTPANYSEHSIREKTARDIEKIQMPHLRDQTPALVGTGPTVGLGANFERMKEEISKKDRTIIRLHSEKSQLEEANLAHTSRIRDLQDNSLLNRNENEQLKNKFNKLNEAIVKLQKEVERKQHELPNLGSNNQEGVAMQKYVNFVLHGLGNLIELVQSDNTDRGH